MGNIKGGGIKMETIVITTLKIKKWNENHTGAIYGLFDENNTLLYSHYCSNDGFAMGDLIKDRPERIEELNNKYGVNNWEVDPNIISIRLEEE